MSNDGKTHWTGCYYDHIGCARAEIERLRDAESEVRESFRSTVEGRCAPDERHCSCVPALRAEIERLRAAAKGGDDAALD